MSTDIPQTTPVNSQPVAETVRWGSVALFILFAFAISWAIWLGLAALGVSFTVRVSIGMFGPALSTVLVRLIRREGFGDAGLRLRARGRKGAWRMYVAAYLVPPIIIALSIGFVMLVGLQHWALAENMQKMGEAITKALSSIGNGQSKGLTTQELVVISLVSQTALAFT